MSDKVPGSEQRYYALDCVRATAMLLGVVYHAINAGMMTGGAWGQGVSRLGRLSSIAVMEWLHSFRMPLFFAISGFFCHMMLGKYGTGCYLARRWWRIGAPMVVTLFAFMILRGDTWPETPADLEGRGAAPGEAGGLELGALWFLWYLLTFATIAPFVTKALGWLLLRPTSEAADWLGRWAIRFGVVPLALGLLSVPALMKAKGGYGWSRGSADGIYATFPDFLFQYQSDMPFYFAYFLAGWWLFRLRSSLPEVARLWLPSMILGSVAFVVAVGGSRSLAAQTSLPLYGLIRLGGYTVYAIASAILAWGFLGFFQRYFNRPTRVGRYLADTAFWIYLVHFKLLDPAIRLLAPLRLWWWVQALFASVMAISVALILFEILVRPTPLKYLFGAASPGRMTRAVQHREEELRDVAVSAVSV